MTYGFDSAYHLKLAISHLRQANIACGKSDFDAICEELIAARASTTRAILMLPRPKEDPQDAV